MPQQFVDLSEIKTAIWMTASLSSCKETMDDGSPTKQLNSMYITLLRYAILENRDECTKGRLLGRFRRVIGAIVILADTMTAVALADLLHTKKREID
jgi:hypothetical protein